jgi:hypothetical protein
MPEVYCCYTYLNIRNNILEEEDRESKLLVKQVEIFRKEKMPANAHMVS